MVIGKAVLLMPFQQPLPQLWPLLLPHLATALNVRLLEKGALAAGIKYASRPHSRHAEGQPGAITPAIQAVVVVTVRMMAEDISVTGVKLTPQAAAFVGLVSRLLLDCVEQHHAHHLGGVLVMLTACLAQMCDVQSWTMLHKPDMQAAFVAGSSPVICQECLYMRTKEIETCMHRQACHMLSTYRHTFSELDNFRAFCVIILYLAMSSVSVVSL